VVVPDALLGLRFKEEEESYFMLEIDRGEMPIDRYKNLHRTYFAKKNTDVHLAESPSFQSTSRGRGQNETALTGGNLRKLAVPLLDTNAVAVRVRDLAGACRISHYQGAMSSSISTRGFA
jgi:hypothetical protein